MISYASVLVVFASMVHFSMEAFYCLNVNFPNLRHHFHYQLLKWRSKIMKAD